MGSFDLHTPSKEQMASWRKLYYKTYAKNFPVYQHVPTEHTQTRAVTERRDPDDFFAVESAGFIIKKKR